MALRGVLVTAGVLAVVVAGGYVADNAARSWAQDTVADSLRSELGLSTPPAVSLGGTPFSLAFLTRSIPDGTASADVIPVSFDDHLVTLTDVRASAEQITFSQSQIVLGAAAGTTRLSYDNLSEIAGVPISWGGDGRLQLTYTVEVLNQQVDLTVAARGELDVDAQELRLVDPKATLASIDLPTDTLQQLIDRIVNPISLRMPYNINLTALEAQEDGLHLSVSARNLAIPLQG